MTPTLQGRWQTRLLVLATAGILMTLIFAVVYRSATPFIVLMLALGLGLLVDMIYHNLQNFRWDGDWPPLFYFAGCVLEGVVLWLIVSQLLRLGITLGQFVAHYSAVWLIVFVIMFGPLKVLFPRWRFNGGQWL